LRIKEQETRLTLQEHDDDDDGDDDELFRVPYVSGSIRNPNASYSILSYVFFLV
jgi:hypothetical protein